jgi:hypothetical protein
MAHNSARLCNRVWTVRQRDWCCTLATGYWLLDAGVCRRRPCNPTTQPAIRSFVRIQCPGLHPISPSCPNLPIYSSFDPRKPFAHASQCVSWALARLSPTSAPVVWSGYDGGQPDLDSTSPNATPALHCLWPDQRLIPIVSRLPSSVPHPSIPLIHSFIHFHQPKYPGPLHYHIYN